MAPIALPEASNIPPAPAHSPMTASSCSFAIPVVAMSASCSLSSVAEVTVSPVMLRRGDAARIRAAPSSSKASIVPSVKARVRTLDLSQCAVLARAALDLGDAAEVRELVRSGLADDEPIRDLARTPPETNGQPPATATDTTAGRWVARKRALNALSRPDDRGIGGRPGPLSRPGRNVDIGAHRESCGCTNNQCGARQCRAPAVECHRTGPRRRDMRGVSGMGEWDATTYEGKDTILRVVRQEADRLFALAEPPEVWERETACARWSARDVVGHIVDTTEGYFAAFDAARSHTEAAAPFGLAAMSQVAGDRAIAFRDMSQTELLERLHTDFDKIADRFLNLFFRI